MPDTPTPGWVAYQAYHGDAPLPWALLPAWEQRQWEAAAQAVLDHTAFAPLDLGAREEDDDG